MLVLYGAVSIYQEEFPPIYFFHLYISNIRILTQFYQYFLLPTIYIKCIFTIIFSLSGSIAGKMQLYKQKFNYLYLFKNERSAVLLMTNYTFMKNKNCRYFVDAQKLIHRNLGCAC